MLIGLLKYQNNKSESLFNIGDYIQSLAVMQFIDDERFILIDRERLDEYKGEDVKLVMNGWFMHCPEHWPPSGKIHPLFVAFHINSSVDAYLLDCKSIDYLKKFEPIGCRDMRTLNILKSKGVEAFFSGCMTLTLGYRKKYCVEKTGKIYFCDPSYRIIRNPLVYIRYLISIIKSYSVIKILYKHLYESLKYDIKKLLGAISFYIMYSSIISDEVLKQAIFVKHEISTNLFKSEEEKFNYADKLLRTYAGARLVITSRIHCALPCLALGTSVIYADKNSINFEDNCRLVGLIDFFNVIVLKKSRYIPNFEFNKGKISLTTNIKNKDTYLKYRRNLIEKCQSFFHDDVTAPLNK